MTPDCVVRLRRTVHVRYDANTSEPFLPVEAGQIVHVEWDREVVVVTWLVPAVRQSDGRDDAD